MREIADTNILKTFCEHFCSIVDKYCKYIIVSGYVAIASGRSRGTEDIDMIIEHIPLETFRKLHDELLKENFICVHDLQAEELYNDYLEEQTRIRYHKKEQYLPEMEIKFAKNPLDNYQIKFSFRSSSCSFLKVSKGICSIIISISSVPLERPEAIATYPETMIYLQYLSTIEQKCSQKVFRMFVSAISLIFLVMGYFYKKLSTRVKYSLTHRFLKVFCLFSGLCSSLISLKN